jgi:hypothetical protein
MNTANNYLYEYRGKVARLERIQLICIIGGLAALLIICITIGMLSSWGYIFIIIVLYFIFVAVTFYVVKRISHQLLR